MNVWGLLAGIYYFQTIRIPPFQSILSFFFRPKVGEKKSPLKHEVRYTPSTITIGLIQKSLGNKKQKYSLRLYMGLNNRSEVFFCKSIGHRFTN